MHKQCVLALVSTRQLPSFQCKTSPSRHIDFQCRYGCKFGIPVMVSRRLYTEVGFTSPYIWGHIHKAMNSILWLFTFLLWIHTAGDDAWTDLTSHCFYINSAKRLLLYENSSCLFENPCIVPADIWRKIIYVTHIVIDLVKDLSLNIQLLQINYIWCLIERSGEFKHEIYRWIVGCRRCVEIGLITVHRTVKKTFGLPRFIIFIQFFWSCSFCVYQ